MHRQTVLICTISMKNHCDTSQRLNEGKQGMRPTFVPLVVLETDTHSLYFFARVSQVRNMSRKVTGELWASSSDALELVAELERGNETVKWELDAENILRSIMWASPEQILLARTYGGVVIQDNTCLTNRYGIFPVVHRPLDVGEMVSGAVEVQT